MDAIGRKRWAIAEGYSLSQSAFTDRTGRTPAAELCGSADVFLADRRHSPHRKVRRSLQSPTLPRELEQSNAGQRLLRTRPNYPAGTRKDQTEHHPKTSLAASKGSRIN
jgi:hypothetical protein